MKNLQKWFTLVELIVVITILAILGTIAFISLQGYSADARNSKRTSDLSSIQSAMTVKVTEGMSIMSFVTAVTANNENSPSIAGSGSVVAGNDYQAGTINFTAIGAKASDFQDPKNDKDYVVGVTTFKGGKYELAASMEDDAGSNKAKVVGTYKPRTSAAIGGDGTATGSVKLTNALIWSYFVNDILTGDSGNVTVTKVSADGLTVTVSGKATNTAALAAAESAGLIDTVTGTGFVVENSTTLLPY